MDVDEAPETLVKVAEASQDVAAGLNKFLTPVADSAPEITAVIGKCFALSSALRDLAKTIEELLQISRYRRVDAPIYDVAYSLDYTFKDIHAIVGQGFAEGHRRGLSQTTSYREVWRDINVHFQAESGNRLDRRLEYCRACIQELTIILIEGSAVQSKQSAPAVFNAFSDHRAIQLGSILSSVASLHLSTCRPLGSTIESIGRTNLSLLNLVCPLTNHLEAELNDPSPFQTTFLRKESTAGGPGRWSKEPEARTRRPTTSHGTTLGSSPSSSASICSGTSAIAHIL